MKYFLVFLISSSSLIYGSCSKPTSTDTGGAPAPPRWVELAVTIDSLPAPYRTGSFGFQFLVTGEGNRMPVRNDTGDTVNYVRIVFKPDPGRQRQTTMSGDTLWGGQVHHLDTLRLATQFTPGATTLIYSEWLNGTLHEFDWAVQIQIGYYILYPDSVLFPFFGNPPPMENPTFATFYVNTQTGDTLTKIHAVR